jgi:signal transduction histidine kinase
VDVMLDRQAAAHERRPHTADSSRASPALTAPVGTGQGAIDEPQAQRVAASPDLGRVRAVIEALPEAVFVTEPDGDLRLTNLAADRLFADRPVQDRSDLLGRFEEIGAPSDRLVGSIPTLPDIEDRHLTVRPRDQPNRWFALRTITLDPGGNELDGPTDPEAGRDASSSGGTVFVLRDITDSRDLRPIREAFLAVLSHELRTPITTIYAGSSVLARRPSLSPSATRALASDISAEAARLYDLVEDLLVLARLERRILEPLDEPVLITRSVDATIRMIVDRLGGTQIDRTGDADVPPVLADATFVDQACRNLVMASIRYAGPEPDRHLIVDVRSHSEADEVTVAVLDRGPALSADELDRAFELGNGSAVGRLAGSGIGPFVCRQLVEAMGGRVWARNRSGGGVETGFALPIDERAQ